jgi:hypothetical protein
MPSYYWFPDKIFEALSTFSWISWIAPDNVDLNAIVGMKNGLGLNPWPTFDWNMVKEDPLTIPFFNTVNQFVGMVLAMFFIIAIWYTNSWQTAHLPINSNKIYDHFGSSYNVSKIIDSRGLFDQAKYEVYSPAYMAAGNLIQYGFFYATYACTFTYAYIYHRHEIMMGLKSLWRRENGRGGIDVHNRLMSVYPEGESC